MSKLMYRVYNRDTYSELITHRKYLLLASFLYERDAISYVIAKINNSKYAMDYKIMQGNKNLKVYNV